MKKNKKSSEKIIKRRNRKQMDPKEIEKLSKVIKDEGDKLLTSQFKFTLTGMYAVK